MWQLIIDCVDMLWVPNTSIFPLQYWNVRCVACETLTVFANDDEHVPEYAVHQDDKTELEMIGVADISKMQRRRAYGELESRNERQIKITSAAQDVATEKNCSLRVLVTKFAMRIWRMEHQQYSHGVTNESAESNGLLINCLSISYK